MPKKESILTVRVDEKMDQAIRKLADEDDRTVAWMLRKLVEEALIARGALEDPEKSK